MTEANEMLRGMLKAAESIITAALHSQPEDDDACREHLLRNIRLVAETVAPVAVVKEEVSDAERS